jgi:hypothetical protein
MDMLKQQDGGDQRKDTAKNLAPQVSTVSKLVKNRDKNETDFQSSSAVRRCKLVRASSYLDFACALLIWFRKLCSKHLPVSSPMLRLIGHKIPVGSRMSSLQVTHWSNELTGRTGTTCGQGCSIR